MNYNGEERRSRERTKFEAKFYDLHYRVERRHEARLDAHDISLSSLDARLMEIAKANATNNDHIIHWLKRISNDFVEHGRRDYITAIVGLVMFGIITVLSIIEIVHVYHHIP